MKMIKSIRNENGFSLVETIIYTFVVILLTGFIFSGYMAIMENIRASQERISTRRTAQITHQKLMALLREATRVQAVEDNSSQMYVWKDNNNPRTPMTDEDDTKGLVYFYNNEVRYAPSLDYFQDEFDVIGDDFSNCSFSVSNNHYFSVTLEVERVYNKDQVVVEEFVSNIVLRNHPH